MPLDTSSILLKLVSFQPEFLETNPLKSKSTLLKIKNDEPEAILVKFSSTSRKLKAKPGVAIIPSKSSMKFKLTMLALNLRHDTPRAYYTCQVVGVKDDEEGERYQSKKIWNTDKLWEKLVTTQIHERYLYVEYSGMLKSGWWKTGDDGKTRILWGVVVPEEGEGGEEGDEDAGSSGGSSESSSRSQEASHEEP